MLQRILVPLDGSERAERGLTMAARLARGSGGALIIARIVNTPPFPLAPYGEPAQIALALIDTAREEADEYLKRVTARPELAGIAIETRAIEGHVTAGILDIARDEQCDLIVICTHGYSGINRWRLGRVAAQVARHAPTPVLVVPAHDKSEKRDKSEQAGSSDEGVRLLITLDGSGLAESALEPALALASALAAPERITAHLLHVVDFFTVMMNDELPEKQPDVTGIGAEEQALEAARTYLAAQAERIQREHPGVTVTTNARLASDVATTIHDVAEGNPAYDYIAMTTHGRGGLQRWAMGSIAERVLHMSKLPLLMVRAPANAAVARDAEAPAPAK